jgi:2-polyprenyl-6-methoxyphenol hydroxylase-like FAD-dependent oxidoreductase
VVVGAGPSGLLLSLLLAKHGIPVHIVEASHELDQQPRAAHYGPPAIPDLQRAGVLDEINKRGMRLTHMVWRNYEDHSVIAGINMGLIDNIDGQDLRVACMPMQDLDALMLEMVLEKYGGTISWQHKVTNVGQDENKAWVECETPDGNVTIEADYVVGCDGANSQVRKSLFGNDYPGYTWDAQIIATNVSIGTKG